MEEKKTFLKPEMEVVKLKTTGMICDSCGANCECNGCWCAFND